MIISIHQPEHFPYEGFFQKMKKSETFVILDNVKFRKNYFQNRNKILDKNGNDVWFGVPVDKSSNKLKINEIKVLDNNHWKKKLLKKLYFNLKIDLSEVYNEDLLYKINLNSIKWCMSKLEIDRNIILSSELGVEGSKTDLIINICNKIKASKYISGPSGLEYLDIEKFKQNNIDLEIFKPKVKNYYSMLYNIQKGIL